MVTTCPLNSRGFIVMCFRGGVVCGWSSLMPVSINMDEEGSGSGLQLFLMRQDKWTRAGEKCICDLSQEESFLLWLITCLTEQLLMGSVSGNEPTATPVSLCPVGSEMTGTPSMRVWESRLQRRLKTLRRKNGKKLKESRKDVENFAVQGKYQAVHVFLIIAPLLEHMDGSRINWIEI